MSYTAPGRRLPALWSDSPKVYAIGAIIVTLPAIFVGIVLTWRIPGDEFGITAMVVFAVTIASVCCLAIMSWVLVKVYWATFWASSPLRRAVHMSLGAIVGSLLLFIPLIRIVPVIAFPITAAHILWAILFVTLCREAPKGDRAVRPPGPLGRVMLVERRGGFNSYEPDAALRQAKARGESTLVDWLMGLPGSPAELLRLAVLIALIAAIVGSALYATVAFVRLPLGLPIAIAVSLCAALFGGWLANRLVRAYRAPFARGLAWGFCAAATFLISLRVVLGLVLAAKFRIDGVGAEQAGIQAFHGAAWFTLMVAMPAWAICVLWGLARRRQFDPRPPALLWRRILPVVFVVAVMIFMAREGAYMDGLIQR